MGVWVSVLALTMAALAQDPAIDDGAEPPVALEEPAAPAVSPIQSHATDLNLAAQEQARSGSTTPSKGHVALSALAGLLVAGPDLSTRDAGAGVVALCAWSDAAGDSAALGVAIATAEWALSDRSLDGNGFSELGDPTQPAALADSVAMGQALLALHSSTGDPVWLAQAQATAGFVASRFLSGGPGFASESALGAERPVSRAENRDTVVFMSTLGRRTGEPRWSGMARHGLAWLRASPDADGATADAARAVELRPPHLVVVGPTDDLATQALYGAARALPLEHRWLEWRDPQVWLNSPSAVPVPLVGPPTVWLCDGMDCGEPLRTVDDVTNLGAVIGDSPLAQGDTAAE